MLQAEGSSVQTNSTMPFGQAVPFDRVVGMRLMMLQG